MPPSITATFSKAGSYTFQVTVTDPGGYIATSSVTVVVNQSLTSIKVIPATVTLAAGGQQQFSGVATTSSATRWHAAGPDLVGDERLRHDRRDQRPLHRPERGRPATVKAASGGVSGTASVTVWRRRPPARRCRTRS